jgi:DNA-binding NarL/FixJ family response regulator
VAVPEDRREHQKSTATVPADQGDRLLDLLSSFSTLRSNGRVLVDQIRGSIHEMRELRDQLRKQQEAFSLAAGNGASSVDTELQRRYGLTRREVEVARLLAQGKSNSAIAAELDISAHTARHHTQHVLSKLNVHSRAEAGAKLRG